MKSDITITNLEDKSEKRLDALITKYLSKIKNLKNIITYSNNFNIPLREVQMDIVKDKINFYIKQWYKIIYFKKWKYQDNCIDNYITDWYIDKDEIKRLKQKYIRENKLNRILKGEKL